MFSRLVAAAAGGGGVSGPSMSNRDRRIVEELILDIGDEYQVEIQESPGFLGSLLGNSATSQSLRSAWSSIKGALNDLVVWVFNFLRGLDAQDLENAANIVRASERSKAELLGAVVKFVSDKLNKTAVIRQPLTARNTHQSPHMAYAYQ